MSRIKKEPISNNIKKRIYSSFFIALGVYAFIIYRLVDIQIIKGNYYTQKQEQQGKEEIPTNSQRGIIYDRNNKKLTDTQKTNILIVQKETLSKGYKTIDLIKKATNLGYEEITKSIQEQVESSVVLIESDYINSSMEKELEDNDIIVEEKTSRYSEDGLLSHTIGHLKKSDNTGQMGIEKSMEDILKDSNEEYVSVFKAGDSGNTEDLNILKGSLSTVKDSEEDRHIKLTIDSKIQKIVESIVDKEENPTAVVVSDIETGEILSICSRPNFDQNNIYEETLRSEKEGKSIFINRATNATYPPGSVFKIVVLYAALENKVVDENYTYNCTGHVEIGKNKEVLKCHKLDGHGFENLKEAFYNSCNTAFFDIAQKVGKEKILEAIKQLHISDEIGIGIEECASKVPENIDERNLAIGQGGIEFTPLQINQLTQIIANNGTYKPLYIYDSVIDNNKNNIKKFKKSNDEEIISPYSITLIKEMMKSVSIKGTAKELSDLDGGSGVKTGTAQSSVEGNDITHGWITGFYPLEEPKYCITVLVEGMKESSKPATPIFKEICEKLNKK